MERAAGQECWPTRFASNQRDIDAYFNGSFIFHLGGQSRQNDNTIYHNTYNLNATSFKTNRVTAKTRIRRYNQGCNLQIRLKSASADIYNGCGDGCGTHPDRKRRRTTCFDNNSIIVG